MRKKKYVVKLIIFLFFLVFFCEYLMYYIVISQCSWPPILGEKRNSNLIEDEMGKAVKVMTIADIHLYGLLKGNWLKKYRSEWQMYRSFQTALTLFQPELVFILGDLFEGGSRCSDDEFNYFFKKLHNLFQVPENVKLFVVPGNQDQGFHHDITQHIHDRFVSKLKSPPVQLITVRENNFILINSMAMEGDGCFICRPAQIEINKIAKKLRCAKGIGKCSSSSTTIKFYSRPILFQHFPMYRHSDRQCYEPDEAPFDVKKQEFHERWNCLSKESSEMIYDILNPRVIMGAHTHHGCHIVHRQNIHEYTIPSFNWRKKNNPSFTLGKFLPNNYAVTKCYLPQESTIIFFYFLGCCFLIVFCIILLLFPRYIQLYKFRRKLD